MSTDHQALRTAIIAAIVEDNYDGLGLRVPTVWDNEPGIGYAVGDALEPSYEWTDGNSTGNLLTGTCAIEIDGLDDIDNAIDGLKCYASNDPSGQVLLIGGNSGGRGEDIGEVIIDDARVLYVAVL